MEVNGGAICAWLLGDEEICSKCVASEKFHGTWNFDIVRLNNEVLLPTEQILNFNQPDDKEFHFWQEIVKFYKFKPHLNFYYQILLPHKTKAVKNLCKKHFKTIKTARIFTRKTKFHLPNLASY